MSFFLSKHKVATRERATWKCELEGASCERGERERCPPRLCRNGAIAIEMFESCTQMWSSWTCRCLLWMDLRPHEGSRALPNAFCRAQFLMVISHKNTQSHKNPSIGNLTANRFIQSTCPLCRPSALGEIQICWKQSSG